MSFPWLYAKGARGTLTPPFDIDGMANLLYRFRANGPAYQGNDTTTPAAADGDLVYRLYSTAPASLTTFLTPFGDAARRPTLKTAGGPNGKPYLTFAEGTQGLGTSYGAANPYPITRYDVWRLKTGHGTSKYLVGSANSERALLFVTGATTVAMHGNGTTSSNHTVANDTWYVTATLWNGAGSKFSFDGVTVSAESVSAASPDGGFSVCPPPFGPLADWAESSVFGVGHTNAQMKTVIDGLKSFYGVP